MYANDPVRGVSWSTAPFSITYTPVGTQVLTVPYDGRAPYPLSDKYPTSGTYNLNLLRNGSGPVVPSANITLNCASSSPFKKTTPTNNANLAANTTTFSWAAYSGGIVFGKYVLEFKNSSGAVVFRRSIASQSTTSTSVNLYNPYANASTDEMLVNPPFIGGEKYTWEVSMVNGTVKDGADSNTWWSITAPGRNYTVNAVPICSNGLTPTGSYRLTYARWPSGPLIWKSDSYATGTHTITEHPFLPPDIQSLYIIMEKEGGTKELIPTGTPPASGIRYNQSWNPYTWNAIIDNTVPNGTYTIKYTAPDVDCVATTITQKPTPTPNTCDAPNFCTTLCTTANIVGGRCAVGQACCRPTPTPGGALTLNCMNLTGPSSATVGQSVSYSATVSSPGTQTGGWIGAGNAAGGFSWVSSNDISSGSVEKTITKSWTPTTAGTYTIMCVAQSDKKECAGSSQFASKMQGPDGSTDTVCAGPSATKTLVVSETQVTQPPTCICNTNNACDSSCSFSTFSSSQLSNVSYANPVGCSLSSVPFSSTPTQTNQNQWCQRNLRTKGDATGDGKVDDLDYFYYVQAVSGGTMPIDSSKSLNVNPDFNGNGSVGTDDRIIVIHSLRNGL